MTPPKTSRYFLILFFLSFVFLMLGNNTISLTNPDEVFYVGTAKEMAEHKTWLVPYLFDQPQFEKPILTYWLLRLSFLIFGVTPFGVRFFPALFGIIGALSVYFFCLKALKDQQKSFLCAFILMSTGLYIGLSRTVFTDMFFSIFISLSVLSFYVGYIKEFSSSKSILSFFIFAALATLTKGPLGFLIPSLIVITFLTAQRDLRFVFSKNILWGFLLFLLITLPWYLFIFDKYGQAFIQEFFYNDHWRRLIKAEHGANDRWYFYPAVMIACMLPWSVFVLASLLSLPLKLQQRENSKLHLFLFIWIAVVFLIFQSAHSKLVSYIFPFFPALAILTGDFIFETIRNHKQTVRNLLLICLLMNLLIPAAIIWAVFKYPQQVGSPDVLIFPIVLFLGLLSLQIIFLKKNLSFFIYSLPAAIGILLLTGLLDHKKFEDFISSKNSAELLLENYSGDGLILCSKPIARGIRFYTQKEVAVITIGGKNYFSPHPIPILTDEKSLTDFFNRQSITYGVVSQSSLNHISDITQGRFKLQILGQIGDKYVVSISSP